MHFDRNDFEEVHTEVTLTTLDNAPVLRVVKKDKLTEFDENTYAKLPNITFHNGEIEVKMLSRLLPDAPSFARGFIGIAFRINQENTAFESFYVRPTNGSTTDLTRKQRACQYFSYPHYPFSYFRKAGITDFEGPAPIVLNQWITLKAVIHDATAYLYINNSAEPALQVNGLKLGPHEKGAIGFFVDTGTEAFFKDLVVTPEQGTNALA